MELVNEDLKDRSNLSQEANLFIKSIELLVQSKMPTYGKISPVALSPIDRNTLYFYYFDETSSTSFPLINFLLNDTLKISIFLVVEEYDWERILTIENTHAGSWIKLDIHKYRIYFTIQDQDKELFDGELVEYDKFEDFDALLSLLFFDYYKTLRLSIEKQTFECECV